MGTFPARWIGDRARKPRTRLCLVLPAAGTVHRIAVMTGPTRRLTGTTGLNEALAAADDVLLR